MPIRPIVAISVIAAVEAAGLVAYAIYALVEGLRVGATGASSVSNGPEVVTLVVILALFGAGMALVARGWWQCRRWARAPFVLAQLIALLLGYELAQSSDSIARILGIAGALLALLGIVLVFTPAVLRATENETTSS